MSDTLDVLTLAEAKNALSIDPDYAEHDVPLAAYITAVSRAFDERFGPVVRRAVTDKLGGGHPTLFLTQRPVASVTSVDEYDVGTHFSLTEEVAASNPTPTHGWIADLPKGIVFRRTGGGTACFPGGIKNVTVIYSAGRYVSTDTVDARFKVAAQIMLAQIWRRETGAGTRTFGDFAVPDAFISPAVPTFAIPNAVLQMLADEVQGPAVA